MDARLLLEHRLEILEGQSPVLRDHAIVVSGGTTVAAQEGHAVRIVPLVVDDMYGIGSVGCAIQRQQDLRPSLSIQTVPGLRITRHLPEVPDLERLLHPLQQMPGLVRASAGMVMELVTEAAAFARLVTPDEQTRATIERCRKREKATPTLPN